jgi:hypothetical protein
MRFQTMSSLRQVCQNARIEERRRVQQVVEELPRRFVKRKADSHEPSDPGVVSS